MLIVLIQIPALLDTFGISKPSSSDIWIILGACVVLTIGMEVVKVIMRRRVVVGRR